MSNISVSITADIADLTAKRAILSAELKAAQKDLAGFAQAVRTGGATNELRAGMLQSAESVAALRSQVGLLNGQMKSLAADGGARSPFARIGGEIAGLRAGMVALGEAMVAAFAVQQLAEFAKQMGEAAEQVVHTAEAFGETAG